MYVMDQQALASVAAGRYNVSTHAKTSKCFATPAMTADRPFEAVLHPTGSQHPPQVMEDGGKPMVYLSWQCTLCLANDPLSSGGLAYAWSTDGVNFHAADAGVLADTLVTDQVLGGQQRHELRVARPDGRGPKPVVTSTRPSRVAGRSCPNGLNRIEVGVEIGKPGTSRADASNVGQFASMSYQTAAHTIGGQPMRKTGSLFPVIAMDSAGTLYEMWTDGDGVNDTASSTPDPQEWHIYYTYSKDRPNHKIWSKVHQVDLPSMTKTNAFGWLTAGDKGKIGFIWLAPNVPGTTEQAEPVQEVVPVHVGGDRRGHRPSDVQPDPGGPSADAHR